MKISVTTLIIILVAILIVWYLYYKDRACYYLPRSANPEVFGPHFWRAFENIANKIPCGVCREPGMELISFMHDVVNVKLEKPIFNKENFIKWQEYISKIKP